MTTREQRIQHLADTIRSGVHAPRDPWFGVGGYASLMREHRQVFGVSRSTGERDWQAAIQLLSDQRRARGGSDMRTCDECGNRADLLCGRCVVCRVRHRAPPLVWTDGEQTGDRFAIETRLTPQKCHNGLWEESVARARRNHPLLYNPCDDCGVAVPEDEHCGATGRYLCPDCYGDSLS